MNAARRLRVGITGVTGMLGTALLPRLIAAGYRPKCLVRSVLKLQPGLLQELDVVEGDINDRVAVRAFVRDCDVVLHLAAKVDHGRAAEYHKVNVEGTDELCAALLECAPGCRLIACSSITVLRRYRLLPWLNTLYARSKALADQRLATYAAEGLPVTTVYPGLIYGPGDRQLVPNIARNLSSGKLFLLRGGEQHAPLVYIDDLCRLFERCIADPATVGKKLIGVGEQSIGIHDFINGIAQYLELPHVERTLPKLPVLVAGAAFESLHQWMNRSGAPILTRRVANFLSLELSPELVSAHRLAEWEPEVGPTEGLRLTLEWCAKQQLLPVRDVC